MTLSVLGPVSVGLQPANDRLMIISASSIHNILFMSILLLCPSDLPLWGIVSPEQPCLKKRSNFRFVRHRLLSAGPRYRKCPRRHRTVERHVGVKPLV